MCDLLNMHKNTMAYEHTRNLRKHIMVYAYLRNVVHRVAKIYEDLFFGVFLHFCTEKNGLVGLNSNSDEKQMNQNFLVKSTRLLFEIIRILIYIIVLIRIRIRE